MRAPPAAGARRKGGAGKLVTKDGMQRLFSTFPNSWPGAGLLVLRVALALPAAIDGVLLLAMPGPSWIAVIGLVSVLASALVLVGLWTPYAAGMLGAAQLAALLLGGFPLERQVLRAAMAAALVMLGPGAWSIDRRLFGRKRIDLPAKPPGSA
jgi:putative oxidoreductase